MPIPEALQVLTTVRDFVRWGSSEFNRQELTFGHGFVDAIDEARYLTLHALSLPPDCPDTLLDSVLTREERERVFELLERRYRERRPAAYISREAWFCGLKFYVDERVLVPRSPMAELIGNHFEPWIESHRVQRILDLGTGSGCIAIAAQYAFPEASVGASDISADALEVAAHNLELHDLEAHIALYRSDLFDAIPPQQFDVIISNPPYVDADDMHALDAEFRHEPELGLAAGNDGLQLVDRILAVAGDFLSEHGVLFIEVGNSQAAMARKYEFLPMTWIDFEFGGAGVCCIRADDLRAQQTVINSLAS